MKRFKKYGVLILLAIIGFIGIEIVLNWYLLYPEKFFDHSMSYGHFTIRSDKPISDEIYAVLDDVNFRLLNTPNFEHDKYDIFFCGDVETYGFFANKAGKPTQTQGFNLQPLNHIFINTTFIQEIQENNREEFSYSILEGSLAHIIAHEICHQLIADEIGYLKMRRVDNWKLEGFCEYTASKRMKKNDTSYQFNKFVAGFFDGDFDNISTGRKFYIESMIMVEYNLDYKNKVFIDLVNDDIDKAMLLQEIKSKNQEKSL